MLRYQLNPHFLFNTLNSISTLVLLKETQRANAMLSRLSNFLRYTLANEPEGTVSLSQEIETLKLYLDIERMRFEERLRTTFNIDPATESALLPSLLLQPLVENAVKHGIAQKQSGGEVVIRARVTRTDTDQRQLALTVEDTGAGTSNQALERGRASGVGLRNVERRLECQYGPAGSLSIQTAPDAGTVVEIRVPLAVKPAAADVHRVAS